jgi:hypothetical protein
MRLLKHLVHTDRRKNAPKISSEDLRQETTFRAGASTDYYYYYYYYYYYSDYYYYYYYARIQAPAAV